MYDQAKFLLKSIENFGSYKKMYKLDFVFSQIIAETVGLYYHFGQ